MFSLQIATKSSIDLQQNILDDIAKYCFEIVPFSQNGIVTIAFVEPESIQKLNKDHRKTGAVTDVLSFHYHDNFTKLGDGDLAGDIILCEERVIAQGEEFGLGAEYEAYKLIIHSLLHLLGYDHEQDSEYLEMQKMEDAVWNSVFTLGDSANLSTSHENVDNLETDFTEA